MHDLLQQLLSQGPRSGRSNGDLSGLFSLSGFPGIPMIAIDYGAEDDQESPVILYRTEKTFSTVRDGVCQQEKAVAGFVGINAQGMFCLGILIYANETDDEPEATWEVCPRKTKVLSALRAIDLVRNHRVEISQRSIEDTYVAVVGGSTRGVIRDEVGEENFDNILTEGPDGLDTILKQLNERGIPFDKQEVTDAMRNGGVEPGDEFAELGIETPAEWDARVAREKQMEADLGPHLKKLLRTIGLQKCSGCLEALNGFALRAVKKGVTDTPILVGVAGVLFIITSGEEADIDDLTTDALGQLLARNQSGIAKVAKFLSVRFRSTRKSADAFHAEVSTIVSEWDMMEDANLTDEQLAPLGADAHQV